MPLLPFGGRLAGLFSALPSVDPEPLGPDRFPGPFSLLRPHLPPWSLRPRVAARTTVPAPWAIRHGGPHPGLPASGRSGGPRASRGRHEGSTHMLASHTTPPFATYGFPNFAEGRPSAGLLVVGSFSSGLRACGSGLRIRGFPRHPALHYSPVRGSDWFRSSWLLGARESRPQVEEVIPLLSNRKSGRTLKSSRSAWRISPGSRASSYAASRGRFSWRNEAPPANPMRSRAAAERCPDTARPAASASAVLSWPSRP